MLNRVPIPIFLLIFLTAASLFSAGIPVELTDPVYLFLQRMENRGLLSGYCDAALPLDREAVARYLNRVRAESERLSSIERSLLEEFVADYRRELGGPIYAPADSEYGEALQTPFNLSDREETLLGWLFDRRNAREEKHLVIYENRENFAWVDVGFEIRHQQNGSISRYVLSDRYRLRGALGPFSFRVAFRRFVKENNPLFEEPLEDELGYYTVDQPDSTTSFDHLYSALTYSHPYFKIGLYHQPISWGHSHRQDLIIARNALVFPYVGFTTSFKRIRLHFIHASLQNDSTRIKGAPLAVRNRPKYLAAHRIDVPLFDNRLVLGLTDMVVYGDRDIELAYLMPLNFFWSIGHTLNDRDNSLIAFDFKGRLFSFLTVYGTLFLDELRFGELGQRWWANKQAIQLGTRLAARIGPFPLDGRLEYSAVRPWTYSHKTLTTNFTHNGLCLGFPFGPNSQVLFLDATLTLSRRLKCSLTYYHLKQGIDDEDEFWGGDPTVFYTARDEAFDHATDWLMGSIRTTHRYIFESSYEVFNETFVRFGLEYRQQSEGTVSEDTYFINLGIAVDI